MGLVSTDASYCEPVPKIDTENLVDANGVAALLGLDPVNGRNTVAQYRRRHADFPAPVFETSRCVLWDRRAVVRWRKAHPGRRSKEA
jgi:hypothetical protein